MSELVEVKIIKTPPHRKWAIDVRTQIEVRKGDTCHVPSDVAERMVETNYGKIVGEVPTKDDEATGEVAPAVADKAKAVKTQQPARNVTQEAKDKAKAVKAAEKAAEDAAKKASAEVKAQVMKAHGQPAE